MAESETLPAPAAAPGSMQGSMRARMGWGPDARWGYPYRTSWRDAQAPGPRQANIGFNLMSANQEVVLERRQAVINSREVDRNNASISTGITKRAVDMVGANLRLRAMPNIEALGLSDEWAEQFAQEWENHFSLWGEDLRKLNDAMRHSHYGPMMLSICRNTYGADGEAAMIIRYNEKRRDRYRGQYATFVEALDPDRISTPDGQMESERLCQGRVLDEWGAYTGFWVEDRPPTSAKGRVRWNYVDRETDRGRPIGVHWFPVYRQGAQRAMPGIIGALREVRMLDTFDQKTLEQAVKAAFMSIYVKTDASTADTLAKLSPAPAGVTDPMLGLMDARFGLYDNLNAEGQAIPVMLPGDEIMIADSSHAEHDTDSFRFAFDRKFANLLKLSYARFANDYSKTSFASIRAELIDCWRMTYADRYQFGNSVGALPAMALLEELIVTRKIVLPPGAPYFYDNMAAYSQCEMRGPGMGWVDPVKDATAAGIRVTSGLSNPQAEAAAQGSDYFDNVDQTARAMKYAERKGVTVTFTQNQQQPKEEPDDDDPDDGPNPATRPGEKPKKGK